MLGVVEQEADGQTMVTGCCGGSVMGWGQVARGTGFVSVSVGGVS